MVYNMLHETTGTIDYSTIGGLGDQIRDLREAIELPLMNPEIFLRVGIKPPKARPSAPSQPESPLQLCAPYALFLSHPRCTSVAPGGAALRAAGDGEDAARKGDGQQHRCQLPEGAFPLVSPASPSQQRQARGPPCVARAGGETSSLRQVVASAIVDKYIGESARLIREMFNYARDHEPCIIFMACALIPLVPARLLSSREPRCIPLPKASFEVKSWEAMRALGGHRTR